jgi:hypothetical protein
VVGCAGQGELVDVGAPGGRPRLDVMDFAPVAGHIAAGAGAATILGVQDYSLPGGGESFGVLKRDRFAFVKDRQVMVGVAGQPDHLAHRQERAAAGECLTGRGLQVFEGGGHDDRGR